MTTLYYSADEHESAGFRPDLDSAFNDGFWSKSDSTGSSVARWAAVVWSVAAWCAGTFVMAKAIIEAAPTAWSALHHWLA